ncbi:hypothetical protein M0Q50_09160 [bacterium]|jgi:hypothetical protein|nr:hypothetical protein [bacterium]
MEKYKIKVKDVLELLSFGYNIALLKNEDYKFIDKMSIINMLDKRLSIDVSDYIDELVLYLYDYYKKIQKTNRFEMKNILQSHFKEEELEEIVNKQEELLINFRNIYKKILINYKFDDKKLIDIQKETLVNLINEHILKEEYEICSEIKKKLDNI